MQTFSPAKELMLQEYLAATFSFEGQWVFDLTSLNSEFNYNNSNKCCLGNAMS